MTSENEYTDAAGLRYVPLEYVGCEGCSMAPTHSKACTAAPPCAATRRIDGRWVIWVEHLDQIRGAGMTTAVKPVTRAEALALITARGRMTRHDYMTATGLSRGSADQMFAELQARSQIEPCGHERTPGRKTWRMQFCATQQGGK